MKQQLAAIEYALNSGTPDLSEPLGLPMSEAIAALAARAEIAEREKGLLRDEKLRARALEKLDTELAAIWLAARPSRKGQSQLEFAMASESGLRISLDELEHRSVNKYRIPVIQKEFRVWWRGNSVSRAQVHPKKELRAPLTTNAPAML